MNIKAIALTAAMLAGSFGAANAVTNNDLQLGYTGDYVFTSTVSTAASFWSTLSTLTSTNGYNSVYSYFSSFLATGETLDGVSDVAKLGGRTTSWLAQVNFNSATSTISFKGATIDDQVTSTIGSVTPVPGPEAGAGLGALAMLGVAYWAKRRRDGQALAA